MYRLKSPLELMSKVRQSYSCLISYLHDHWSLKPWHGWDAGTGKEMKAPTTFWLFLKRGSFCPSSPFSVSPHPVSLHNITQSIYYNICILVLSLKILFPGLTQFCHLNVINTITLQILFPQGDILTEEVIQFKTAVQRQLHAFCVNASEKLFREKK